MMQLKKKRSLKRQKGKWKKKDYYMEWGKSCKKKEEKTNKPISKGHREKEKKLEKKE